MKYVDAAFVDPARNLACDEALLELAERNHFDDDLLCVWESQTYFVVLGHANSLRAEVRQRACEAAGVAIFRRMSGGGTVMQGPGCLNYSLILHQAARRFGNIGALFRYVLGRHRELIEALTGNAATIEGVSDLVVSDRKVSGNAQYRKSSAALIHGTFLLSFDLSLIDRFLNMPARKPLYRRGRPHAEFLANLNIDTDALRDELIAAWQAKEKFCAIPLERIDALARERYAQKEWSEKF